MDVEIENLTENVDDKIPEDKFTMPHKSPLMKKTIDETTLLGSGPEVEKNRLPPNQSFKSLSEVDEGNKQKYSPKFEEDK